MFYSYEAISVYLNFIIIFAELGWKCAGFDFCGKWILHDDYPSGRSAYGSGMNKTLCSIEWIWIKNTN